jgi:hypothetical protein
MAQFNRITANIATRRWQDWGNLVLAVWLFFSPWILRFTLGAAVGTAPSTPGGTDAAGAVTPGGASFTSAAWDAWILGVVVAIIAIAAMVRAAPWQVWATLILGIWVFIAPWILSFTALANAAWDHWIVGALVFLVSLSALTLARPTSADFAHAGDKPLNRP